MPCFFVPAEIGSLYLDAKGWEIVVFWQKKTYLQYTFMDWKDTFGNTKELLKEGIASKNLFLLIDLEDL